MLGFPITLLGASRHALYTVTYSGNSNTGGSAPTDGSSPYIAGVTVTVLANSGVLVRTSYAFNGWNTAANGSGTDRAPASTFSMPSANVTLYAKWAATYTVTYSGNGNTSGSAPVDSSSPYVSGVTVTVLGNTGALVKTGYTFDDWNTAADGSGTNRAVASTFSMPAANTSLFAKWVLSPHTLAIGGSTSPYLSTWTRSGTEMVADAALSSVGSATQQAVSWSDDGQYLAAITSASPWFHVIDYGSGSPSMLTDPATIPTQQSYDAAWSPDGRYLAIAQGLTSPRVTVYDLSTGSLVKVADPATIPTGDCRTVHWSPNSQFLACGHGTSPYLTVYDISSGSLVKLSNPATLPGGFVSQVRWSHSGTYLATSHDVSPRATFYSLSGTTLTKIANPASLPPNNCGCVGWSHSDDYVALGSSSSPYLIIYAWNAGAPVKTSNPASLPGTVIGDIAWQHSSDIVAVAVSTSSTGEMFKVYDVSSGTPVVDAHTLSGFGTGARVGWNTLDTYLAVGTSSSQGINVVEWATKTALTWHISRPSTNGCSAWRP